MGRKKKAHESTVILKKERTKKKKGGEGGSIFHLINAEKVIELGNHCVSVPTVITDSGKDHHQMLTTQ